MIQASVHALFREFSTVRKKLAALPSWWPWPLKFAITALAFAYVFHRLQGQEISFNAFVVYLNGVGGWMWMFPLVSLMPVNWGIEAKKWQILLAPIVSISFGRAFKSVLSGITFGLFTPNRLGDFIGRILYLPGKKMEGAAMAFINATALSITTLCTGAGALIAFFEFYAPPLATPLLFAIEVCLLLLLPLSLLVYFHLPLLAMKVRFALPNGKFQRLLSKFELLSTGLLLRILLLSVLRFAVFSIQYYLAFRVFGIAIGFVEAAIFIPLSLFAINLLPVFPISDILVRESVMLLLFPTSATESVGLAMAVFTIWAINIALPAIFGNLALIGERLVKK